MNRKTQLILIGIGVVLSIAMAGSATCVLAAGMGFEPGAAVVYASAAAAALLAGFSALGGAAGLISAILLVAAGVGLAAVNAGDLAAVSAVIDSWRGMEADAAIVTAGGKLIALIAAYALGAVFAFSLTRREFAPMAVFLFFTAIIVGFSLADGIALGMAVPGLIAAVAAFAITGSVQQDAYMARVLIPAVLCVILALIFVPGERLTWQPLENAAGRVRDVFEQYFNFSRERIAFSINEMGYDHAGRIEDEVVAKLGGPANPDKAPVMTVRAEGDILLRGTIRTEYTGYSWVDTSVKNRYLYYDLTHARVRDGVFNRAFKQADKCFVPMGVSVEMLDEGTSTLFVPAGMEDFSMDLSTAVYYNSAGEIFLSREAAAGDTYSLTALDPVHDERLSQAVMDALPVEDDAYPAILEKHIKLPAGIESEVYSITVGLTEHLANPYEKAAAIRDFVRSNAHYTLDVEYPPEDRDFVSYFLLDYRKGYCSYFASAMAVMCRMAGLPARYVEGYAVRPDETGEVTLTGEDAHAWVEVYFNGIGWIPFDPSAGDETDHSGDDSYTEDDPLGDDDGAETEDPEEPFFEPSPSPTATPDPGDGDEDGDENESTPPPALPPEDDFPGDDPEEPEEDPFEAENDEDPFEDYDGGSEENNGRSPWLNALLLILLALILIALGVMWTRRRLEKADPVALSAKTRDARMAAMIIYRANLTLLAHMGQAPMRGESPEAFAARIAGLYSNPDFTAFIGWVSMNTYAGRPLEKEAIQAGRRAYAAFMESMRPMEKVRFTLTRVFHGLGDFESIP